MIVIRRCSPFFLARSPLAVLLFFGSRLIGCSPVLWLSSHWLFSRSLSHLSLPVPFSLLFFLWLPFFFVSSPFGFPLIFVVLLFTVPRFEAHLLLIISCVPTYPPSPPPPTLTHLRHKVLTYVEYRAVSGVFQNIDPTPLSAQRPASVSSPRNKTPDIGLASYSIISLRTCSYERFKTMQNKRPSVFSSSLVSKSSMLFRIIWKCCGRANIWEFIMWKSGEHFRGDLEWRRESLNWTCVKSIWKNSREAERVQRKKGSI